MKTSLLPALVLALATIGPALPAAHAEWELPAIDKIVNYQPKLSLQVFTADGVEMAQFGTERRQFVPIAKIPKLLQEAVIAVEDARFREHRGIDPKGMARALLSMATGGRKQGASTITQQMTRTVLLGHQRTVERKAKEIILAMRVEEALSKDRILEIYMNEIFLGQRSYGFAAAAQTYFGKPMDKLSIAETAMLAGLPQNPYYANPVASLQRATLRQHVVLQRMAATGVITAAQAAAARAEKLAIRSPLQAAVRADHVAEMARRVVVERFGTEAYSSGIRVHTSLRAADQQAAWAAVRRAVLAHDRKGPWRGPEDQQELPAKLEAAEEERAAAQALREYRDDETLRVAIVLAASPKEVRAQLASGERISLKGEGLRWAQAGLQPKAPAALALRRGAIVRVQAQSGAWAIAQWPQVEAGFVALDPASGRIRALVGGFDFTRQPFNHVTQAWRQPGSAFKPFLYSAALEHGVMPATLIDDAPFTANGWSPQNSDGRFDGPLSLRDALAKSKNLVSVRLAQQIGVGPARDWAGRFGFDLAKQPANLTLALGAGSVTPLQLASAYATLANGGWSRPPILIERITDANGKLLFEAPAARPLAEEQRVIPARNVYLTSSLLNEVTRSGTAARAQRQLQRSDLYGKTGTTNDAVDAWFAGFHPSVAAVAWMGFDDARSLGERESGGGLALPIWIDYMAVALKGIPVAPIAPPPDGLVRSGDDWLYDEWADGGWIVHIGAEAGVTRALPRSSAIPAEPSTPVTNGAP
ncbi:penicillin-binding protein 1A [Piscinibacter sakaiensis]|uniref:penicillin-binding protein 1A n=1 Tax=Piscinibacter sakaiensis TaxID=1547922 RepID=UPI003AABB134